METRNKKYGIKEHTMSNLRIAIVTGSTRPGRNNEAVARWVDQLAQQRTDAQFELVDIYNLPLLDEPIPVSAWAWPFTAHMPALPGHGSFNLDVVARSPSPDPPTLGSLPR